MGLLTEYFTAPDAARAAAVVAHGPSQSGLEVVDAGGVEPFVHLGSLEEILTGRSFDEVLAAQPEPVALEDGGPPLVTALPATLVAALAALTDDQLGPTATTWAGTEEFAGLTDPDALADLLRELRTLARRGEPVWC